MYVSLPQCLFRWLILHVTLLGLLPATTLSTKTPSIASEKKPRSLKSINPFHRRQKSKTAENDLATSVRQHALLSAETIHDDDQSYFTVRSNAPYAQSSVYGDEVTRPSQDTWLTQEEDGESFPWLDEAPQPTPEGELKKKKLGGKLFRSASAPFLKKKKKKAKPSDAASLYSTSSDAKSLGRSSTMSRVKRGIHLFSSSPNLPSTLHQTPADFTSPSMPSLARPSTSTLPSIHLAPPEDPVVPLVDEQEEEEEVAMPVIVDKGKGKAPTSPLVPPHQVFQSPSEQTPARPVAVDAGPSFSGRAPQSRLRRPTLVPAPFSAPDMTPVDPLPSSSRTVEPFTRARPLSPKRFLSSRPGTPQRFQSSDTMPSIDAALAESEAPKKKRFALFSGKTKRLSLPAKHNLVPPESNYRPATVEDEEGISPAEPLLSPSLGTSIRHRFFTPNVQVKQHPSPSRRKGIAFHIEVKVVIKKINNIHSTLHYRMMPVSPPHRPDMIPRTKQCLFFVMPPKSLLQRQKNKTLYGLESVTLTEEEWLRGKTGWIQLPFLDELAWLESASQLKFKFGCTDAPQPVGLDALVTRPKELVTYGKAQQTISLVPNPNPKYSLRPTVITWHPADRRAQSYYDVSFELQSYRSRRHKPLQLYLVRSLGPASLLAKEARLKVDFTLIQPGSQWQDHRFFVSQHFADVPLHPMQELNQGKLSIAAMVIRQLYKYTHGRKMLLFLAAGTTLYVTQECSRSLENSKQWKCSSQGAQGYQRLFEDTLAVMRPGSAPWLKETNVFRQMYTHGHHLWQESDPLKKPKDVQAYSQQDLDRIMALRERRTFKEKYKDFPMGGPYSPLLPFYLIPEHIRKTLRYLDQWMIFYYPHRVISLVLNVLLVPIRFVFFLVRGLFGLGWSFVHFLWRTFYRLLKFGHWLGRRRDRRAMRKPMFKPRKRAHSQPNLAFPPGYFE